MGRVYFWAHHMLDVTVGACIGYGAVLFLGTVANASWGDVGCMQYTVITASFPTLYGAINARPVNRTLSRIMRHTMCMVLHVFTYYPFALLNIWSSIPCALFFMYYKF